MPIAPGDGLEEGEEVDMDENVHCVNGYCIDRKYNKLELPSAGKTHVRMNLEVSLRNKKNHRNFLIWIIDGAAFKLICTYCDRKLVKQQVYH